MKYQDVHFLFFIRVSYSYKAPKAMCFSVSNNGERRFIVSYEYYFEVRFCYRYWSGNDHFFKHWKNPVSAITDCDGYLVLAQVCSLCRHDCVPKVRFCRIDQLVTAGHEPLHDGSQQSFCVRME